MHGATAQIEVLLAQLKTDGKFDASGDVNANALTDGLLILRATLGLSGDPKQILTWIEATHGVACLP